ncbi:MAG: DUF6622 family protein [Rhodoferax sp.]
MDPSTRNITMLMQIITNTPHWVWALLASLLWLGLSQALPRSASLKRITIMPVAMTGLSLYGTVAAFGAEPQVLLLWLTAASLMVVLLMQRSPSEAIRYDPATRRFAMPGSWVPLLLIMGLFATKYVVGATSAMQPGLAHEAGFSLGFTLLYGAFSGVFLARAAGLWRIALQLESSPRTIVAR